MDAMRSWAMAICFACVLGSILTMFFPDGSSKKLLNMIVSMMILCVIFKPISSLGKFMMKLDESAFEVSQYENDELNNEIASNAENIYASYLRENILRVLGENNISYENVTITMDTLEDYSISIGQVEVIVKNEDVGQKEKIKSLLKDYVGADTTIEVITA
ncbi:MAG: stage III sporulation protein AF [Acutalibacteraceae bacterium]|nr:stage III sporulation protein AF [Bacillota bacterium]